MTLPTAVRQRFAERLLEHLDAGGFLVTPEGARGVHVAPEPDEGTKLDIAQARPELGRLVHERDQEARLLFEAADCVGLALWVEDGRLGYGILRLGVELEGEVTDAEWEAFAGQLGALLGLIRDAEPALVAHLRATGRTGPPANLLEQW